MIRFALAFALIAFPALADEDDLGTLNPPEMGIASVLQKAGRGETSMMVCASGYYITKKGDHEDARRLFEACARDGWLQIGPQVVSKSSHGGYIIPKT